MLFHYSRHADRVKRVTVAEADRDWRHTDVNDDEFIVRVMDAKSASDGAQKALSIARRWIVIREDDDCNDMGDLGIQEIGSRRADTRAFTVITQY